eukprot:3403079-Rhodomonas_salina.3
MPGRVLTSMSISDGCSSLSLSLSLAPSHTLSEPHHATQKGARNPFRILVVEVVECGAQADEARDVHADVVEHARLECCARRARCQSSSVHISTRAAARADADGAGGRDLSGGRFRAEA